MSASTSGCRPQDGSSRTSADRDRGEHRRRQEAQGHAVEQPAVALVQPPGAVRVRHERLEAEQEAHAEDGQGEEQDAADADRANRFRAQRSDDDRVHQPHRHPPDLGEDDRTRELQHRPQLVAKRHTLHYDRPKAHGTRLGDRAPGRGSGLRAEAGTPVLVRVM